jgi:hypothetical protein
VFSKFQSPRLFFRTLTVAGAMLLCSSLPAVQPQDGYFYGVEMQPVGAADITVVENEPAVALVFAIDEKNAEVTRQFDAWFQSTDRPQVQVYAIAVNPEGLSNEVALEAINQRDLHMPVFLAASDMLLGDDYRVLVLNEDSETARFSTLDLAGVYDELKKIGVSVTAPAPVLAPTPAPVPAATPVPPAAITTTTVTATTTTVVSPSTKPDPLILGGDGDSGIYINNLYGMRVQFPPGWQYRVAGKRDGAVAIAPEGSEMDMRIWALPADGVSSPQDYVDQRLKSIAETNRTRVHVERHVRVLRSGRDSVDVTYTYTKPIDPEAPARGGLVWRGRMLVFLDDNYVKAAGVSAPSGPFMAAYPVIESFMHSFEISPSDISPSTGYPASNSI